MYVDMSGDFAGSYALDILSEYWTIKKNPGFCRWTPLPEWYPKCVRNKRASHHADIANGTLHTDINSFLVSYMCSCRIFPGPLPLATKFDP